MMRTNRKKNPYQLMRPKKIFNGEKTSILQFKSKKKNARRPYFKARVYLDPKFRPKFEIEKINPNEDKDKASK